MTMTKDKWEVSHEKNDAGISTPAPSDGAVEEQTEINEKALLRKMDMRVLPALTILYLLSFLDRSNGASATVCHGLLGKKAH